MPPEKEGGKPRKTPFDPRTGTKASSTNSDTWTTHAEASEAVAAGRFDGLGFAMSAEDGIVFIDLDHCRNQNNKSINQWALDILNRLNSYSEVSQSGTGVHVFVRGNKPGERCKTGNVEMYGDVRFAYITDRRLERFPDRFEPRQAELDWLYREHIAAISQIDPSRTVPAVPAPEEKLAELLKNRKAATIFKGEQNGKYKSQSEADLALMTLAIRVGWTEPESRALIEMARTNAKAEPKHDTYYRLTFFKARGDVPPMKLSAARAVFARHLNRPDSTSLDVSLAVIASSHLEGDPIWLHMVGPPSSGKTEQITAVDGWPTVYSLSELTPAGLVSGINSEDGQDHSLLPHLHCRTMAIKDFTTVLELPKDVRQKLFARLRDAFDGSQTIHNAAVGTRSHKGSFNCLTGVTNAIEKVARNTSLGERYLLFRMVPADPLLSAERALEGAPVKKQMRNELRLAACGVLAGVDQECIPTCSKPLQKRIIRLAAMLAQARTFVDRDHKHQVQYHPDPEGPSRIAQQLFKLGQGLALINGRKEIDESDLVILRRVAVDSLPSNRRRLLEAVSRRVPGRPSSEVSSGLVEERVGLSQSAVHQGLDDLVLLGVVVKRETSKPGEFTAKVFYKLAPEFRALADGVEFGTAGQHGTAGGGNAK